MDSFPSMPPPPPRPRNPRPAGSAAAFSTATFSARSDHSAHSHSSQIRDQESACNASVLSGSSLDGQTASQTSMIPTSAFTVNESNHGRLRRRQRQIAIRDLKKALKHGTRRPGHPRANGNPTSVYVHKDVTYVVDDITKEEITSYSTVLELDYKPITEFWRQRHRLAKENILMKPYTWKSHSVLLIDTSGSMRQSDVKGTRTRLGAVWVSIAQDFIMQRIQSGQAGDSDVVTIVLMGETAHVLFDHVPTDWLLYNSILKIFKDATIVPKGHGYYLPALDVADHIIRTNNVSSCHMMLWILSDGRPSDSRSLRMSFERSTVMLREKIEALASQLGRRLTVSAIGMGSAKEFGTLNSLVDAASDYGSVGIFKVPSMSCSGLGAVMSSIATSLATSQTELSVCLEGGPLGKQRRVRQITRENRRHVSLSVLHADAVNFDIFMHDKVLHMEYDRERREPVMKPLQHASARGVAKKKRAFGEGSERFAFQFFEVAEDGVTVVGAPLVAKESRFVDESMDFIEVKDKFAKRFLQVQQQARDVARSFNEKLDQIATLDPDTPRVTFLDCSVYYLDTEDKGEYAVIVERHLNGKFQKWNTNNGWTRNENSVVRLAPVAEESEMLPAGGGEETEIFVKPNEVAQAFSHFSYVLSGKKRLICDLQGVYDRQDKLLRLTDPVIHYHDVERKTKKGAYGRTDRGQKGIQDFFASHECNALCDLVCRGFFAPSASSEKGYRQIIV